MPAELRQAVILAAGSGQRMGRLGRLLPKVALPVGNRPLYAWHLDLLADAGVDEVVLVMAPNGERLRDAIGAYATRFRPEVRLRFVTQARPSGIAHALALCGAHLDERFAVLLGDTWLRVDTLRPALQRMRDEDLAAVLSVREERRPEVIRRECTIRLDGSGRVAEIREKPRDVLSELKPCGLYLFTREILAAIERTEPSALRGELELTDAIGVLVRETGRVGVAQVIRHDVNLTSEQDLLDANMRHLRLSGEVNLVAPSARVSGDAVVSSSVVGEGVTVPAGATVLHSLLLPGAGLGRGATVRDAVLYGEGACGSS